MLLTVMIGAQEGQPSRRWLAPQRPQQHRIAQLSLRCDPPRHTLPQLRCRTCSDLIATALCQHYLFPALPAPRAEHLPKALVGLSLSADSPACHTTGHSP